MDWLLQIRYVSLNLFDSVIEVVLDIVYSFLQMGFDAIVVIFVAPHLLILELLDGFTHAIDLSGELVPFKLLVLRHVCNFLFQFLRVVQVVFKYLLPTAHWVVIEGFLADKASFRYEAVYHVG